MNKDYTSVLKNIINDELEGRCSESECVEWLYSMGLTTEDLEELGYGYLNDLAKNDESDIDGAQEAWHNSDIEEEAAK